MWNNLSGKEIMIMSLLRQNARESLTNMSKRSKIPISTIYDKIKTHEKDTIKRHTCIIDFTKLGFNTRAAVSMKVCKTKRSEIREFLLRHPNVNSIYKINNGFDFWVETIFRNIKDLEDFLELLEQKYNIKKDVHYIIDDIKREAFMSDPKLLDIVA